MIVNGTMTQPKTIVRARQMVAEGKGGDELKRLIAEYEAHRDQRDPLRRATYDALVKAVGRPR